MIRALWTAASGMEVQQTNLDVTAHNLANVNSIGFKKSRAEFQDVLYQTSKTAGTATLPDTESPTGVQVGLGSRIAAVQKIFVTGDLQSTGNELDVAIEGVGFFQVADPNGETYYTRAGALKRDSNGQLMTSEGYPLVPAINIPANATSISIGQSGAVEVLLDGQNTPTQVGNIELARFGNPAGLSSLGRSLYAETGASGDPEVGAPGDVGFGTLAQGFLENSNVSVMEEMVNMIAGQRAYEANSKAIQTADEMLSMANNLVR